MPQREDGCEMKTGRSEKRGEMAGAFGCSKVRDGDDGVGVRGSGTEKDVLQGI